MDHALFARAFGAFFAVMNPFVMLPVFLGMTAEFSTPAQRRLGLAAAGFSALLGAGVMLGGSRVLSVFGISVNDFRVAGGLVLMMIGLGMLNGSPSPAHHGSADEQAHHADIAARAFYPIAFPMLVGPGTITTILVFMGQASGRPGIVAVGAALAADLVLVALVLTFAAQIGTLMSKTLRVIVIRLMGMILAAVAVEMIATGIKALLPGLG